MFLGVQIPPNPRGFGRLRSRCTKLNSGHFGRNSPTKTSMLRSAKVAVFFRQENKMNPNSWNKWNQLLGNYFRKANLTKMKINQEQTWKNMKTNKLDQMNKNGYRMTTKMPFLHPKVNFQQKKEAVFQNDSRSWCPYHVQWIGKTRSRTRAGYKGFLGGRRQKSGDVHVSSDENPGTTFHWILVG